MSKSRRKHKIALAWFLGILSVLGLTYVFLDEIIESTIDGIAKENDIEISSLDLEHLNVEGIYSEKNFTGLDGIRSCEYWGESGKSNEAPMVEIFHS